MGNPVLTRTVTVPVGATGVRLDIPGKYIKIVSNTAVSVLLGFDASTPERVYTDDSYAGPATGFHSLRFVDDLGAGCTVVVQISEQPILGGTLGTLAPLLAQLTAAAASLVNIDTDLERLKPGTAKTGTRSAAIAQTGVSTTSILAANANRKSGMVQADIDNTGRVWLGTVNTVTQATSWYELLPGATSPELKDTIAVWACSENGTEMVRYYETT